MKEDIEQYVLNPDLTISKNKSLIAEKQPNMNYNDMVLCPFCLKSFELGTFFIRKGLRVCPNCGSQLKLSTLTELDNLDKFVSFVFNYRLNNFWSKICPDVKPVNSDTRFKEWNKRLSDLGISQEFWDKYKLLKGDIQNESEWH